jgi:serine phosphatase RsbU (regulator of sigma subunit)
LLKTYFLYFYLGCAFCVCAQNRTVDSLLQLARTSNDTTKVLLISRSANLLTRNDPAKGEIYGDSALRLAKKLNYPNGIAAGYNALAYAQNTIGKYDAAIQNLLNAIDEYTKINHRKGLMQTYNTLANSYLGLKDYQKAYKNYYKCFELANTEPLYKHMIAISSVGLGNVLIEEKKYEQAISYFKTAEKEFINEDLTLNAAYCRGMVGEAYYRDGKYEEAEKNILTAIPVFEKENDEYALGLNLFNLGSIELARNNFDKAIKYLRRSFELNLKRNAWDNIQENAFLLSEVYEKKSNASDALKYYKVYMQYKDSVINKERNKAIADAESKYESEKKEQELLLKGLELEKSELKVSQRNNLIYVFASAILLFTILLFFVYRGLIQKKKANTLLQNKNDEIEKQKAIIEEKNKDITDSINYSRHIQQAIIPSAKKVKQFLPHSFIIFKPKDIVSGDFYLVEEIAGLVYLAVIDCTGHGVPGAMLSVFANSSIKNIISTNKYQNNPAEVLKELCIQFKANLQSHKTSLTINDGVDMSLCIINKADKKLFFAGAKNGLLKYNGSTLQEYPADRWSISGSNEDEHLNFTNHQVLLAPGDKFYLSTDGFIDQFGGPKGKKFKQKQLKDLLVNYSNMSFDVQADNLINDFTIWKGMLEQIDDVTLVGFEVA